MNLVAGRVLAALPLMALAAGALASAGWSARGRAGQLLGALRRRGCSASRCVDAASTPGAGARLLPGCAAAQDTPAPRDAGFWGELGYRIERSLRLREHGDGGRAERLRQFLSAIEASPNGVLLLDASDQIEWCNSQRRRPLRPRSASATACSA